MKTTCILLVSIWLSGCATNTNTNNNVNWRWEKRGASSNEFDIDNGQCKAQGFAGTGGMLNWGTIIIIDSCMQGKGWYKVNDR
jgi:hypothetical protein